MSIQRIEFDRRADWNIDKAKAWMKKHGFRNVPIKVRNNDLVFKLVDPTEFVDFRLLRASPSIEIFLGFKRPAAL